MLEAEQVLCRVTLSNLVHHQAQPLYRWIVDVARREGLQGATVLKGFMGLRSDGAVLRERRWRLAQEVPVVIEIVDGPRAIEKLLTHIEPGLHATLVTLERAHVAIHRSGGGAGAHHHAESSNVIDTRPAAAGQEVRSMKIPEVGVLMRVFIGESDRDAERNLPLYESIVLRAREAQLAGVTVFKGAMGFGRHSRLHTSGLLELSTDLPMVIEVVDAEDKINAFVPVLDGLVTGGLVTLESVRVLKYVAPDAAKGAVRL